MSQQDIRKALDKALVAIPGGLGAGATSFENLSFNPPTTPYQRAKLLPLDVENPTFGDQYHREQGVYQVTLSYPRNKGVGAISSMAELIKDFFRRGKSFTEGTTIVNILRTPSITSTYTNGDRVELNIRIRYYTNECPT